MAGSSFNNLLRQCVINMSIGGAVQAVSSISGYRLSERAKSLLIELVALVMNTEYFKLDTKIYLSSKYRTYRNVVNNDGCSSNNHTSRSRINYDLSKLRGVLGEDALDIIIKYSDADLTRYEEKIKALYQKYRNKSLLDGFTLRLPECNEIVTSLTDDEVINLLGLARIH